MTGDNPLDNGLVLSAKTDRDTVSVCVSVYADMVQCEVKRGDMPGDELRHQSHCGCRKPITGFSRKSRLNMLRKLAMIENIDDGLFVTLTYPDHFPIEPVTWKRDLAALRKRIARRFPKAGGLWRMETKTRKSGENVGKVAPHYHLLILGVGVPIVYFRLWLRAAWYEIAHRGDKNCGSAAVQVDKIRSRRHAIHYLSKYMAKDEDDPIDPETAENTSLGRYWGIFGNLAMAAALVMQVSQAQFIQLKRLFRAALRSQNRTYARRLSRYNAGQGVTLFRFGVSSCHLQDDMWDTTIVRMLMSL